MQKLTINIDASAIKESSCGLRLFYNIVEGYKEKLPNNDIVFGKAFHNFREKWRITKNQFAATALALQYYKTAPMNMKSNKQYLTSSFITDITDQYDGQHQDDTLETVYTNPELTILHYNGGDRIPLIESNARFAFPLVAEDDIDILCCGTMDEIAQDRVSKKYHIVDCKTTSSWNWREYFDGYKLDPQLMMYRWALKQYAAAHPETIWAQLEKENPSCMIEGAFYKGGSAGGRPSVEFKRSEPFNFTTYQLEEFQTLLLKIVWDLVGNIREWKRTGNLPLRQGISNGSCLTKFGPCKYFGACSKIDAESRESELEFHFVKKPYDPLSF